MKVYVFLESDDQSDTNGLVAYDVYLDKDYDPKTGQYMERVFFWTSRGIGVAVTSQDRVIEDGFRPEEAYIRALI